MLQLISRQLPKDIHPASWWILGFAIAAAATVSRNLLTLGLLCAAAITIMALARTNTSGSTPALKFYILLSLAVLVSRLIFRILFNVSAPEEGNTALFLPDLELNLGFGDPVSFLGNVSFVSLYAALFEGLRLSAIILGVGVAVTLSSPRKLLKSVPAALYEIATSVSMAVNLAPQIIKSAQRVRVAQKLRGRNKKLGLLVGTIIPVLEDALDRSQLLAASMSARGFGHQSGSSSRVFTGSLSLAALLLFLMGTYLSTTQGLSNLYLSAIGACCALASLFLASRKSIRTKFRKTRLNFRDAILFLLAIAIFITSGLVG